MVAEILVLLRTVNVIGVRPNRTEVAPVKPVPVMISVPLIEPVAGTKVIVGAVPVTVVMTGGAPLMAMMGELGVGVWFCTLKM